MGVDGAGFLLSSGAAGPAPTDVVGWVTSAFRKGGICYINAPAGRLR